jgi:hypothetical protein
MMTQDELDSLHAKWRGILAIDLDGNCELVKKIDDDGSLGECLVQYGLSSYKIRILDPYCVIEDTKPINVDTELTLVHELIHVKTWWMCIKENIDVIERAIYEKYVEDTARVMIALDRRG